MKTFSFFSNLKYLSDLNLYLTHVSLMLVANLYIIFCIRLFVFFSSATENNGQLETTRAALADAHAKISQLEKAESDASSLRVKLLSAQQHSTQLKLDIERNTKKCAFCFVFLGTFEFFALILCS